MLILTEKGWKQMSELGRKLLINKKDQSGTKFDSGKSRLDLIPAQALEEIGQVLAFGANKYASWNWTGGIQYSRLIGAALRHMYAHARGQDKDPESGLSHLAHAGCCIMFLIWMARYRQDLDDRHPDEQV